MSNLGIDLMNARYRLSVEFASRKHSTTRCPFIYYSSNISMAEATAVSYAKAAEKGKEAEVAKQAEEEKNRAEEKACAERARREEHEERRT